MLLFTTMPASAIMPTFRTHLPTPKGRAGDDEAANQETPAMEEDDGAHQPYQGLIEAVELQQEGFMNIQRDCRDEGADQERHGFSLLFRLAAEAECGTLGQIGSIKERSSSLVIWSFTSSPGATLASIVVTRLLVLAPDDADPLGRGLNDTKVGDRHQSCRGRHAQIAEYPPGSARPKGKRTRTSSSPLASSGRYSRDRDPLRQQLDRLSQQTDVRAEPGGFGPVDIDGRLRRPAGARVSVMSVNPPRRCITSSTCSTASACAAGVAAVTFRFNRLAAGRPAALCLDLHIDPCDIGHLGSNVGADLACRCGGCPNPPGPAEWSRSRPRLRARALSVDRA